MARKKHLSLLLLSLAVSLLACGSDDLLSAFTVPTLTPTFIPAKFATPTPTLDPAATPTAGPTETAPATAKATRTKISPLSATATSTTETPVATADEAGPFDSPPATPTDQPEASPSPLPTATPIPTGTPVPTPAPLAGRLAFSVDDGGGHYDVWVIDLPDGDPFTVQKGARQPSFSNDGRLLVNLENSPYEDHIGLLDVNYSWLGVVSDSPDDAYPFWHPDGSRYVYSNPRKLSDPVAGGWLPHVFIPCSLRPPWEEQNEKCRDIGSFGKVGTGEFPVWTDDDRIAFFSFEGDDGIYVVKGASALWEAGGLGSTQLLVKSNGRPSDTQGYQVYFSAGDIDQNWEAYMIDLDGSNLVNLSNSPDTQDGLPTVSPDGTWVAFVSDRDGRWAIWGMPRTGGEPVELVDFSAINTNPSPVGRRRPGLDYGANQLGAVTGVL